MSRAFPPPPPTGNDPASPAFRDWFYKIQKSLTTILFTDLDFTGSNLTSILTRNHNDLQSIQGGASNDYYHLTSADKTDLTDGGATTLHKHDHAAQDNLNSASYYHLTQTNHTDLTDGGDSTLHYHASDRDSANFTGTNWTDLTDSGDSTLHYHATDRDLANATGVLTETKGGTGESTYTTGDILYASASNALSKLPIGAEGKGLIVTSGIPAWGNVSSQVKVYEPAVIGGFFTNVTYTASEPKLPELVTVSTGDIVTAWGGDYAT